MNHRFKGCLLLCLCGQLVQFLTDVIIGCITKAKQNLTSRTAGTLCGVISNAATVYYPRKRLR